MSKRITITAEQRDAVYELSLDHLSGISDLWLAISGEDFEAADRQGREFSDELRLILDDLGWGYGPVADEIELTLPPEDLHRIFSRFHISAASLHEAEEHDRPADVTGNSLARTRLVIEACERVLGIVARRPPSK